MLKRERNWKRRLRFLRMIRKRKWRWPHVYGRLGEKAKAQESMKGLTGSSGGDSGQDIFAAASRSNIDPAQTETTRRKCLLDIGDNSIRANSIGWGHRRFRRWTGGAGMVAHGLGEKFQRGENLEAMRFLTVGVASEPVGSRSPTGWGRCSRSKGKRRKRAICMRWPWQRAESRARWRIQRRG